MEHKFEVVYCEYTNKEVVAVWDEEHEEWLHLHNELLKQDLQDVEYFEMTNQLLKRDINGDILSD